MTGMRHILWLALVLSSTGIAQAMNAEERLLFANGLYRRNLYEIAVPEYQALMTNEAAAPMRDLAAFRLGECFRSLGRTNEAATAYDIVISDHPQSLFMPRASFRRAEIDWQQGRLKDAATRLQKILEATPPADIEAAALYYLGLSQFGLDRFRDAERNLRRMLRSHAESPYADYARLALADLLEQRAGAAAEIADLLNKVADKPETPALGAEALAKAGRLAYREREMNEASRCFSNLAAHYPDSEWNERVRLDAAWAHLFSDKLEKARIHAVAGLAAAGQDERPVWLYLMANVERQSQNATEARRYYDDLLAAAPDHELAEAAAFEALNLAFQASEHKRVLQLAERAESSPEHALAVLWMQAGAYRALGRPAEAAPRYERIVAEFPASDRAPAAAYQLALMADEDGDHDAAAAAFARIAEQYHNHEMAPDAWMAAAAAHLRTGQTTNAITAWTRLIKDFPDYGGLDEAMMGKARAEALLERDNDAAQTLTGLISAFTNSRFLAEANYLRGTLFEKSEDYEEAEFHYRRALNFNPAPALIRQIQHRQVAVLQRQGRHAEAADLLNRLLGAGNAQSLPSPLLEWLARWNLEQRDYPSAEVAARRLAETGESPAWRQIGTYAAGIAALELKKIPDAIEALTAAAAFGLNTRETALASYQLGLISFDKKEHDAAIAHFSRAAEHATTDAAMDIRARSYLQLGMSHEAREEWTDAGRYYLSVGVLFDDPEITPESLYRAAGALHAQQQTGERDRMIKELNERYPDSEWNRSAGERWPVNAEPQPD